MQIIWGLFDDSNDPITGGAASTSLKIRREADGYLYDWNDSTFKASGWTTVAATLSEIDATNLAGYYKKDATITGWNDGRYIIVARYTGSPKRNADLDILVEGGKVIDEHTADALDMKVSDVPTAVEIDTELSSAHGSGAWGASGAVALPVMQGSVYEATAIQQREVRLMRGDTPRIYFDLGDNYTGWTPKFGAKAALSDTEYAIAVKDGSWTDASAGEGYIDLSSDETGAAGVLIGEIELQKDTQRLTAMRFKLVILEDVID